MTLKSPLISTFIVLFLSYQSAKAGLVLNGGFETGDFTDWNYTSAGHNSFVANDFSHSGNYAAFLGDTLENGGGSISQMLATTVGEQYMLSFWFAGNGDDPSGFKAIVGGNVLFDVVNPSYDSSYNLYTFGFTAATASTLLEFEFFDDPFYINLDDVDVVSAVVPEPSSAILLGIGLVAITFIWKLALHFRWCFCHSLQPLIMKSHSAYRYYVN